MAQNYSPKIVQDSLVMCLDASNNKSYPATDLPVKNGLVMWMDAADDTTFSYSSGTTVSQWRDKSGFNYHMVPVSAGPTRNSSVNSRKTLTFTTSQDIQNLSIDLRTSAYSIFVVDRYTNSASGTGRILTANSSYNNWLLGHWASETNKYYANGWVYQTYAAIDTNWKLYLGDWGGSSNNIAAFYTAGTSLVTNSTNVGAGPWTLGINANTSEKSNCEAAEIIVFNRLLSAIERKLVHTYLGQKWGVSNTDRSIIDLSGNNNNGLLGDGVTADMPLFDVYNKGALKLDGSNDYVAVANATSLNPTTVTVSIWVKRNGYQSQTANYLRRNYNDAYGILGDIAADNVRFRIHNGTTYPESPNATLSLNEWTNIVGTYDLANIKIYRNGVFVGQTAHTSAISYASANTTLTIGRDDPISGRYMNANYGSVLIYSRALSAAEVAQNYEAQKSKFANTIVQQGLVLNLDAGNPYSYAGAGTTWYDVSGTGNNGTLTNGPTYNSTNGGVVVLDGVDDYITCANNASLQITSALTLEIWFYNTAAVDGLGMIVKGPLSGDYDYMLYLSGTSTAVYFYKKDSIGNPHYGGITLSLLNRWLHIVVTHTSGGLYTMYVNGVASDSSTFANSSIRSSSNNLLIGAGWNPDYFYGNISQTRIYNIALSAAQVLQNYNATKGRFGL